MLEGTVPLSECQYPDLFSSSNGTCMDYRLVHCVDRPEPKAPCKLNVNQDKDKDKISNISFVQILS